jgi:hypothetical protein
MGYNTCQTIRIIISFFANKTEIACILIKKYKIIKIYNFWLLFWHLEEQIFFDVSFVTKRHKSLIIRQSSQDKYKKINENVHPCQHQNS